MNALDGFAYFQNNNSTKCDTAERLTMEYRIFSINALLVKNLIYIYLKDSFSLWIMQICF